MKMTGLRGKNSVVWPNKVKDMGFPLIKIDFEYGPVFIDAGNQIVIVDADKDQRSKIGSAVIEWLKEELKKIPKPPRVKSNDPDRIKVECEAGKIRQSIKTFKEFILIMERYKKSL